MYTKNEVFYIKALTPIHAGTGQTLSNIDMPIQREKHSNIPKIEASSLKGAMKHSLYQKFENEEEISDEINKLEIALGSKEGDDHASAMGFTDARLLFFPMRSATDIYRLVTCPYILKRWVEDKSLNEENTSNIFEEMKIEEGECIVTNKEQYKKYENESKVILEEYVLEVQDSEYKEEIKLLNELENVDIDRIVIVSDSDFVDFVSMYTEIITRNRIDINTGVAKDTGLFTEEYLPAETIMYFLVLAAPSFDEKKSMKAEKVLEFFKKHLDNVFQVGGNATVGKGFVKII